MDGGGKQIVGWGALPGCRPCCKYCCPSLPPPPCVCCAAERLFCSPSALHPPIHPPMQNLADQLPSISALLNSANLPNIPLVNLDLDSLKVGTTCV